MLWTTLDSVGRSASLGSIRLSDLSFPDEKSGGSRFCAARSRLGRAGRELTGSFSVVGVAPLLLFSESALFVVLVARLFCRDASMRPTATLSYFAAFLCSRR